MILRLLLLLPDNSQGFFEESGGEFAVRSLEAHRVNLDLALSGDDDFDGAFHGSDSLDDEFDDAVFSDN